MTVLPIPRCAHLFLCRLIGAPTESNLRKEETLEPEQVTFFKLKFCRLAKILNLSPPPIDQSPLQKSTLHYTNNKLIFPSVFVRHEGKIIVGRIQL